MLPRRGRFCCEVDDAVLRGRCFRDGDDAAAAGTGQCLFMLDVVSEPLPLRRGRCFRDGADAATGMMPRC